MQIKSCKTNHMKNPLGFHMTEATVSWVTANTMAKRQLVARVKVALDPDMNYQIYDTDMDAYLDSRGVTLPIKLEPRTRYYWTVTVEGDNGDTATSEVNYFETAKIDEPWQAKWLSPPWKQRDDDCDHPYVRKQFSLPLKVAEARIYMTGMGIYELFLNGNRVGDEVLAPHCNAYDAWVQYQTYDVTEALNKGENAIGVMLANGWAKGRFGLGEDRGHFDYTQRFSVICEMHVTYEDGTTEVIATDDTWLCKPSPVLFDNIYDGVSYDANKEIPNWCSTSLSKEAEADWEPMQIIDPTELGELTARLSLPVKCMEEITPIELIKTPAGETVLDMGQNMVGWLKMRISAPKGTKITISHGEIMQNDNFYRDNLRSAQAQFIYIADGTEKIVEPRFSFYGFRFAKIEGIENVRIEDFTGCVLYSELETIGNITTSDQRVNQLFKNALWGHKGNFLDVPTDCPQRDERMGWTGDTQVFSGTAMFNMASYAFYVKFLHDLYEDQRRCDGMVPSVVPLFSHDRPQEPGGMVGCCAWADCATIVPMEVYQHTGDDTVLRKQFQSMKDWVDWITRKCAKDKTGYLWTEGFHFGDWLALDGDKDEHGRPGVFGGTPTSYLASAFYRHSSLLVAQAAEILGHTADAKKYAELSANVREAIQGEYFTANGQLKIDTQTAYIIAVHFDLTDFKADMVAGLKKLLEANNMHLTTGFIGTPYLCRVLSNNGESESAYELFFQEDYPSWLYPVSMGATTIWERWNSVLPDGSISDTGMNSLNHYAYGSIAEWMYRDMCGINPDEPGFKRILLKPEPNERLHFANAEVDTAMGLVKCGWKYNDDGSVTIEAEVPFNTEAELVLPCGDRKLLEAGCYSFTA